MTTTAPAALTGTYRLDPGRTRIGFVARQALVARVRGRFERFEGQARLDFAEPARSTVELTIDTGSVSTGNRRRDRHLCSAFFDAAAHPHITFRSTTVEPQADGTYVLVGDLTIRGRTRPFRVSLDWTSAAMEPDGRRVVEIDGRGTLDRRDWGVAWNVVLEGAGAFVSRTIGVELDVTAVWTQSAAPDLGGPGA